MEIADPVLTNTQFNYPTAIYLAHACAIAYEPDPLARARQDLRLEDVEFNSVADTEYFIGDGRDFSVLAFRGTQEPFDWFQDARVLQVVADGISGRVHKGFHHALNVAWSHVAGRLRDDRPLFVCGHSLGGAVATLASCQLATRANLLATYTFGSPRVGDADFCRAYTSPNYRVVNRLDVVPELPLASDEMRFLEGFAAIGQALSRGNRFIQMAMLPMVTRLLEIRDGARVLIPPQYDLDQMFGLIASIKPFQGQVGAYQHVDKLVTIEGDGGIRLGGKELEWARSILRAMFSGQSPAVALQHHKMIEYIAALTAARDQSRPILT